MTNTVSAKGLALIQEHEGFQAQPAPLGDGRWVVGHNHVRVGEAGAAVSQAEAADLLALDLAPFETLVNERVTQTLTQSQFDALVSFAFSVGADAFSKSQVVRRANGCEFVAAACAMDAWRKSEIGGELVVDGTLVRRRAAEKALFLRDTAGKAAPSSVKRAQLDYAASVLGAPEVAKTPVAAPKLELVVQNDVCVASREPGVRLTEILKSEPATEALLLTQVAPPEFDLEDEIVTAHAKPVARTLKSVREATRRDFEAKLAERAEKRGIWKLFGRTIEEAPLQPEPDHRLRDMRAMADVKLRFDWRAFGSFDNYALFALLGFGLALIATGAWMLLGGTGDFAEIAGAAALMTPGVAAALMAGVGLRRAPRAVAA